MKTQVYFFNNYVLAHMNVQIWEYVIYVQKIVELHFTFLIFNFSATL